MGTKCMGGTDERGTRLQYIETHTVVRKRMFEGVPVFLQMATNLQQPTRETASQTKPTREGFFHWPAASLGKSTVIDVRTRVAWHRGHQGGYWCHRAGLWASVYGYRDNICTPQHKDIAMYDNTPRKKQPMGLRL